MAHWLVNTHVAASDLTLNNDTCPMLRIRPVSDIDCKWLVRVIARRLSFLSRAWRAVCWPSSV